MMGKRRIDSRESVGAYGEVRILEILGMVFDRTLHDQEHICAVDLADLVIK